MDASVLPLMQVLKNMSIKGLYCGRFYDHSLGILNSENAFDDKALESLNFFDSSTADSEVLSHPPLECEGLWYNL